MPQDLIGCRKRRKLKALIPRVVVFVDELSSAERIEGSILLSFYCMFYGRMVGKYALICATQEIQKIHMVGGTDLLRICFIYGK